MDHQCFVAVDHIKHIGQIKTGKVPEYGLHRLWCRLDQARFGCGILFVTYPVAKHAYQLFRIDRLGDKIAHAAGHAFIALFLCHACTQGNYRKLAESVHLADFHGGFHAAHFRHVRIHQNRVVVVLMQHLQGLDAVIGNIDGNTGQVQKLLYHLLVDSIVFCHQYPATGKCLATLAQIVGERSGIPLGAATLDFLALVQRCHAQQQFKAEGRAIPRYAVDLEIATHQLQQAAADGKPEAGSPKTPGDGLIGLAEWLKQFGLVFLRNADAAIADAETDSDHGLPDFQHFQLQLDTPRFSELDGIANQVGQHLPDTQTIANQLVRQRRVGFYGKCQLFFFNSRRKQVTQIVKQDTQAEWLGFDTKLASLDLGEIQDIVQDTKQVFRGSVDFFQVIAHVGWYGLVERQLR